MALYGSSMSPSEILQARHDELVSGFVKWVNRYPDEMKGECCLVMGGDYALVNHGDNFREAAAYACWAALRRRHESDNYRRLVRWNDRPTRQLDEVLAVLLKAKRLALKEGR